METKRLTTGSILGVVAIVMLYVAAILMLFLPICNVKYEYLSAGTSTLLGSKDTTLTGIDYMAQSGHITSGLHIFFFIAILLLSTVTIPMFGDTQMNTRSCLVGIRCVFMCAVFAFLAAYVFDVATPLRHPAESVTLKIKLFTFLNGGVLVMLLAVVSLILNVVSTVLSAVEKESVRRGAFFAAQCKYWRAEEVLICVFTALCGGLVACLPYLFVKNYWKRKYGDIRTKVDDEGNNVIPSVTEKRRHSATLNYFSYAAKLLSSYKELLDNGTISTEEYELIKRQLISDASAFDSFPPPADAEPKPGHSKTPF